MPTILTGGRAGKGSALTESFDGNIHRRRRIKTAKSSAA
jgi:hypothetical protein